MNNNNNLVEEGGDFNNVNPLCNKKLTEQFDKPGLIDYDGCLLALAAIRNSKDYEFSPVVVQRHEIKKFLTSINDHIDYLKGQQISIIIPAVPEDQHWTSYVLFIEENSDISLLAMDSLGGDEDYVFCNGFITEYLNIAANNEDDPQKKYLYIASRPRQSSLKGCSVFAIDDVKHVLTADNYLPQEGEFPLLNYVKNNSNVSHECSLPLCNLPLLFMRTAQTTQYIKQLEKDYPLFKSNPEGEWRCNKGKSTVYSSFKNDFFFSNDRHKLVNGRIEKKLQGIKNKVEGYVEKKSDDQIKNDMKDFTVDEFIRKISFNADPSFGAPSLG